MQKIQKITSITANGQPLENINDVAKQYGKNPIVFRSCLRGEKYRVYTIKTGTKINHYMRQCDVEPFVNYVAWDRLPPPIYIKMQNHKKEPLGLYLNNAN